MFRNWMPMTSDAVMLALESQSVIGLRLMKLSRGGRAAEAEAMRMVAEKKRRHCRSRNDFGPRRLAGVGNPALSNACASEQAALVEALATEAEHCE